MNDDPTATFDGVRVPDILVVNLWPPWTNCTICGVETPSKWGVPVWNGDIVANDWPGEWGGVAACEKCWEEHERGMHVQFPTPTDPVVIAELVAEKNESRRS